MAIRAWRAVRPFLPRRSGLALFGVIVSALAAAALEAILVIVVVSVALAVARGDDVGRVLLPVQLFGVRAVATNAALAVAAGCGVVVIGMHAVASLLTARLSAGALERSRAATLSAFSRASWARQAAAVEGALEETVGALARQASLLVRDVSDLVTATAAIAALTVAAAIVDPGVAVVVAASGAALFVALGAAGRITRARSRAFVDRNGELVEDVAGWARMARERRLFGVDGVELERLAARNRAASAAMARMRFATRLGGDLYRDLAVLLLVGAIAFVRGAGGDMSAFGAVALLVVRALGNAQAANVARQLIAEHLPNLDALRAHVSSLDADAEPSGTCSLATVSGIELLDVGYDHAPGRAGVDGVSLSIAPGETVGVTGPSGGGKTTLAELVVRLRRPQRGTVLVSGIACGDIAADSWHRLVALVPQEPLLFAGTIAENIRYWRAVVTDDVVLAAARASHVLDPGLDLGTRLGPRGSGVSGGQKQRIAIARALAGAPQLLVLDEPTSALDERSERLIQETVADLRGTITLVIVSHRPSMLASCDRVVTIAGGTVAGIRAAPVTT